MELLELSSVLVLILLMRLDCTTHRLNLIFLCYNMANKLLVGLHLSSLNRYLNYSRGLTSLLDLCWTLFL